MNNHSNLHKRLNLHSGTIKTPILWLGHDFKNPIDIWSYLSKSCGILINACQLLKTQKAARDKGFSLRKKLNYYGPMFIDSGGFLFQKSGRSDIKVEEIIQLYNNVRPDIGAILDIPINYTKASVTNYRRWKMTLNNTERMLSNSKTSCLLVPVIHSHSSKAIHYRIRQIKKILPNPKIICIGSLVPLLKASYIGSNFNTKKESEPPNHRRWRIISRIIISIRNSFPESIIHAFGVGSLSTINLLLLLGVDSVDTVSWRMKAAFGEIQLPGLTSRKIVKNSKSSKARKSLAKQELSILDGCKCPICNGKSMESRIRLLIEFKNRAIHNAFVLMSELAEIRKQKNYDRLEAFVSDRMKNHNIFKNIMNDVIINELKITHFGSEINNEQY